MCSAGMIPKAKLHIPTRPRSMWSPARSIADDDTPRSARRISDDKRRRRVDANGIAGLDHSGGGRRRTILEPS